ncbi:ATP-binding protein [Pseudobutyrivibrio xylanivorans]|uniref:ATP-binding protein n=1 Tax=Pseudobutyrivibrio xylanivorans TaxID=185007 RepID=A0A5P6VT00_PSEXY|nr:ATP-binding protein [Pseudobutyrivibrio xylanivorans]QFJ55767.1 ATP-binding protein [Pseudobutyrivibrio xylanivorans]
MVTRTNELKRLEAIYQSEVSNIVLMYGRLGSGKESLMDTFTTGKSYFYYRSRQCSDAKQLSYFDKQMRETYSYSKIGQSFEECFKNFRSKDGSKHIVIIDEAQFSIKKSNELFQSLVSLKNRKLYPGKVMVLIVSSSIVWAENTFPEIIGNQKSAVDETIKLENLSFLDVVRAFPDYTVAQSVSTYGIIGGVADYVDRWNGKKQIKANVCEHILSSTGFLYKEAEGYISTELRELSCYNTILGSIASGNEKLNDLFEDTGYSRAKISVYMKNLAAFDVVDKVVSFETGGWDNTKKGVYRIVDPYINFWFTFVYPHLSELTYRQPESFYNEFIAPYLDEYLQSYFVDVCREYLHLLNVVGQLPIKLVKIGTWIGKEGTIDVIGQSSNRENVVGICNWAEKQMSYSRYEELLESMKKARITANTIYLFSATKFDSKLVELSKENKSVVLVDMTEL